jgi:hypothetical protein
MALSATGRRPSVPIRYIATRSGFSYTLPHCNEDGTHDESRRCPRALILTAIDALVPHSYSLEATER